MMQSVIRVAIIEDHTEVREGLALLIGETPGYSCIHKFGTMEEALEKIGRDLPDVVLADIGLPGMSGIEGIRFYPGELTLFTPMEREPGVLSLQAIWRKHARTVSVVETAGAHSTRFSTPNAESAAASLALRLLLCSGRTFPFAAASLHHS